MKIRPIFGKNKSGGRKKDAPRKKKQDAQKGGQPPALKEPTFVHNVIEALRSKEAASIFSIIAFFVVVLSSVFISPHAYQRGVQEGDISLRDIYAPYDFTYEWGVNEDKTKTAKMRSSESVPFIIRRDAVIENEIMAELGDFFSELEKEKQKAVPREQKVLNIKKATSYPLDDRDIIALLEYDDTEKLKKDSYMIAGNIFIMGFMAPEDMLSLEENGIANIAILDEKSGKEILRTSGALLDEDDMERAVDEYSSKAFTDSRKTKQAVEELIIAAVRPNLKPDEKMTSSRKEAAIKDTPVEYYDWEVKKNELIVEKGQRVNSRHIAQLVQLRSVFFEGKPTSFFLGTLLLVFLLGSVAAIYVNFTQRVNILHRPKELGIVLLNMFFIIVVADFVIRSPQPSYFIPLASTGMIIMLIVGFGPALLSSILMSVLIAVLAGGKVEVAFVLLIGSIVGMYAVRNARRRATILWAGFLVGAVKFLSVISAGLINGIELQLYIKDGLWGIASGIMSSFIVLGLLPLYEHLFKIPTDISLLELSDLNHPLLKELAIEAPGTYHHSILVGNLAEAACDSIGANSLLARVGSYYHDIGKIAKAPYFSENEMGAGSKHEKLAPSMSALIISKHVKEGVELAKKYKLNTALLDFIGQHHGDSLISFFYQKAIKKSENGVVVNENNFRYPGPKPQTKETAIVLLADAVEAVSRTLDDPTPSSIRNLVKKVINNKFIDEQLDECDLTLRDIHNIADAFAWVLMGVFHTRPDYPEEKKEKEKEKDAGKNKH